MILKEKAIRIAKRILAKRIEALKHEDSECNDAEKRLASCADEDSFLSGFGGLLPEENETVDAEFGTPEQGSNFFPPSNEDKVNEEEHAAQGIYI